MPTPRETAVAAMTQDREEKLPKTFLGGRNTNRQLPMNFVVTGAIPIIGLGWNPVSRVYRPFDLVTLWGFGDFEDHSGCSAYYNPDSPWYNVFYGAYAIRSYKRRRIAWGYNEDRTPNIDELLQICEIDYNFITALEFGCPPEKLCFEAEVVDQRRSNGWDVTTVTATVPSGLHDAREFTAEQASLMVFGTPHQKFLDDGRRESYEPVQLRGEFFMRELESDPDAPPVTLVWGTACPDNPGGEKLLHTIIDKLSAEYMDIR